MKDYRDDHSPDIALLLTVAWAVRVVLVRHLELPHTNEAVAAIDAALKPFVHYSDPTETQEPEHV